MIARPPPATSTTATRTIDKGVFIATSLRAPRTSWWPIYLGRNEPKVNAAETGNTKHFQDALDYRSRCGKPADSAFRRLMARAWNGNLGTIPGWPEIKLVEPPVKSTVEIAWSDFPEG